MFSLKNNKNNNKKKKIKMSSSAVVIGALTLSTLGKIFSRKHAEIFFLIFPI